MDAFANQLGKQEDSFQPKMPTPDIPLDADMKDEPFMEEQEKLKFKDKKEVGSLTVDSDSILSVIMNGDNTNGIFEDVIQQEYMTPCVEIKIEEEVMVADKYKKSLMEDGVT